jgi:tRNA1Val (adenine37-N6)-methyltransferase
MLLGALAQHESPKRILDAGAGCGVLGLMMAQRFPKAQVTCIELDEEAADECYKNIESSPFQDRIQVIHADLLTPSALDYDLIISNPPYYFTDNSSSHGNSLQKHSTKEEFSAWIRACYSLLSAPGTFWMIYPSNQANLIAPYTRSNDFHESKRFTLLNQHQQAVRIISAYSKQQALVEEHNIPIRNSDGTYSAQYLELTKEFHAKIPLR